MISDLAHWSKFSSLWIVNHVGLSTRGEVSNGTWSTVEGIQSALQVSLEGVGLLVSDPALVVLVEVVPGIFEVCLQEVGHFGGPELVSGFQDGSCSESGLILHEEFLASLVTG